jgi:hypothetical protein
MSKISSKNIYLKLLKHIIKIRRNYFIYFRTISNYIEYGFDYDFKGTFWEL